MGEWKLFVFDQTSDSTYELRNAANELIFSVSPVAGESVNDHLLRALNRLNEFGESQGWSEQEMPSKIALLCM